MNTINSHKKTYSTENLELATALQAFGFQIQNIIKTRESICQFIFIDCEGLREEVRNYLDTDIMVGARKLGEVRREVMDATKQVLAKLPIIKF